MLASDESGFLTGKTVSDIRRVGDILAAIRSDLSTVKKMMLTTVKPSARTGFAAPSTAHATPSIPASSHKRDSNGRFASIPAVVAGKSRNDRGQFTSNKSNTDNSVQPFAINKIGDKLAGAIVASGEGLEGVDPSVKAFQEVAQPLARTYQLLSGEGGNNGQNRWLRRIFKTLKLTKKDDTVYQKATRKSLKEIEDKTGLSSGSVESNSSFFSGIFKGKGKLLPKLLKVAGIAIGAAFSPVGLAIGAAAVLAWGIFTDDGRKFFSDIGDSIKKGWNGAIEVFKNAIPSFSEAFDTVVNFTKNNIIEPAAEVLTDGAYPIEAGKSKGRNSRNNKKPSAPTGKAAEHKSILVDRMIEEGIVNPNESAMFLSQMDHESNGFTSLEENLNYKPAQLMSVSKTARGKGFKATQAAIKQGPESVAELMYGGRKDLGNTEKGDGYLYRGRGFTQLTGRANYTEASKALGIDLVGNPDLAAQPETAAKIATWFHKKNSKLVNASRSGDVTTARKLVNGGTNGLADVNNKYNSYLSQTRAHAFKSATSVSAPMPSIPAMAKFQSVSDSPPVVTPLSGGAKRQGISVTVAKGDVTQDMEDRKIAHIATGGISSS